MKKNNVLSLHYCLINTVNITILSLNFVSKTTKDHFSCKELLVRVVLLRVVGQHILCYTSALVHNYR